MTRNGNHYNDRESGRKEELVRLDKPTNLDKENTLNLFNLFFYNI